MYLYPFSDSLEPVILDAKAELIIMQKYSTPTSEAQTAIGLLLLKKNLVILKQILFVSILLLYTTIILIILLSQ